MISFRLRAKWQNCRGYVPRYERTPKNGWFDIHSVFATHVEGVVLLSKLNTDKHIHVEIQLDELDITKAEKKATYETIKGYIKEKHNVNVSTLYIAQIKKKYGLDLREHYNISKKENQKIPTCPLEKEKMIVEALQHFGMLEIA